MNKNIYKPEAKVAVITLGCSKNLVDSEELIGILQANNFAFTENYKKADYMIVNTCGFIKPAKEESINVILEAAELRKMGKLKKLVVTGCLSERYASELKEQIEGVDHFFGVNAYADIIKALARDSRTELNGERRLLTPAYLAYLKIAEGCNRLCSFCAIPLIRGRHASRTPESIVAEAERLVAAGVKEINIIAQDTTYYGIDIDGEKHLPDLLEKLSDIKGAEWIRLMYTYPAGFPERVMEVIAERNNICNYVDMPLQHVSDRILKSMRRAVDGSQTRSLVDKIREKIPGAAIRSAFIVGYPGETDKEFRELYDFISRTKIDRVGVFVYSHEENTPAWELEDNVPEHIKIERRDALMLLQQNISLERNKKLAGSTLRMIVEEFDDESGMYAGRTEHDAPDVDNSIYVKTAKKLKPGTFADVKVTSAEPYDLFGEMI